MDHSGGTKWASLGPNEPLLGPKKVAKMVSADTIFIRFSITWAQFLARMVSEMAPKPSKYEEHMYSKQLRPKNKNGQNYPILGLIDGGYP